MRISFGRFSVGVCSARVGREVLADEYAKYIQKMFLIEEQRTSTFQKIVSPGKKQDISKY